MRYVFHPEALSEYAEAVQYYAERRIELAQAFIDTVEEVINRIKDSPNRWQIIDEDVRSHRNRLLLVSFTERPNSIRIISTRLATRRECKDYEQNAFQ